jgi:hypothetical protein
MTPKSIVDAKGDLIAASANDTPARLAVGSNGEQLVADSTTATGLRYQEPLNLNPVLNSGFDIFQRGTASTAIGSGTFLADRWQAARTSFAAGSSQSRQATGDTTNLPNIQYCLRVQRDSTNTSTEAVIVGQNVESVNSIPYAGKTITMSFYARAGANFSAASGVLSAELDSGTGTDQNLITSGTLTGIDRTVENKTLTTTWQRFTVTKAVASTATQLAFQFFYTPVGTAGANDYFEVTGVMINIGSAAYPFRRTTGTIQGELAACQRYFWRAGGNSNFQVFGNGIGVSTTSAQVMVSNPVPMRTIPTSHAVLNVGLTDTFSTTAVTSSSIGQQGINQNLFTFNVAAGLIAFRPYLVNTNNTTNAYIEVSAEL